MTWLAAAGGLALGAVVAYLVWQLGKERRRADRAEAEASDAERRLDEIDRNSQQQFHRQEAAIRVVRAQRDEAQRKLAAVAHRHPDLADEFFYGVLQTAAHAPADGVVPNDDAAAVAGDRDGTAR